MSYRNKTYVAFASEDIHLYRLMEAWRDNKNIDFNFFDAHDLNTARDSSLDDTIRRRLRERLANAKQVVLIGSGDAKRKGNNEATFLGYEVKMIIRLNLPVVVANYDGDRSIRKDYIPRPFLNADYYTLSVALSPKIIKFALDKYVPHFAGSDKSGPHYYEERIYENLDA